MIIGIGNDLCDCRRIEVAIQRHGSRFLNRIFTIKEQERSLGRANKAANFAKIFCAKEAMLKALGTGLRVGIFWTDIEIDRQKNSSPKIFLHKKSKK